MGKALYRKYRSKQLSEIVGQEHITTSLQNALDNQRVGHAYLFTGPRGVGKTSIARILAHEVNGLTYNEDATHLDIIEIDAASNRRIDEIRTLRERVHNAPASAKFKVYIIDEVHMLTKEAFNALLKTLEEPPAHVIFILATTEIHKLPETIISRTQRYTFKPADDTSSLQHLKTIAKSENINISDDALEMIARHGQGSFRDSISLLDQIANSGKQLITIEEVQKSLGIAPDQAIQNIIELLENGSVKELISELRQLHNQGYQAPQIAKQISSKLRELLINNTCNLPQLTALQLIDKLIAVPAGHEPYTQLEITLLEPIMTNQKIATASINKPSKPARTSEKSPELQQKIKTPEEEPVPKKDSKKSLEKTEEKNKSKHALKVNKADSSQKVLDDAIWNNVILSLKQKHSTLYGLIRMATPKFETEKLVLTFDYPFHQKRLSEQKNTNILVKIIEQKVGNKIQIECVLNDKPQNKASKETPPKIGISDDKKIANKAEPLDTISNIFGGGEILE